jgi:hypothetical protein
MARLGELPYHAGVALYWVFLGCSCRGLPGDQPITDVVV